MVIRASAAMAVVLLWSLPASAQNVEIGVLGLFHPRQITLSAASDEAVVVTAAGKSFVLPSVSRPAVADMQLTGSLLLVHISGNVIEATEVRAASRNAGPAAFILVIPGKIRRTYLGTLAVKAAGGVLVPVVTMDLETAVSSVVQAESSPDATQEALKAQAVVTRSYFVAGTGRHHDYDFCDLTHCQWLRDPPVPGSPAALATAATRRLVLTFQEKPIAPMFTRSCGGRTRTPAELGIVRGRYPYFAVNCDYCRQNPWRWSCRISQPDAARLLGKGEAGRLALGRRLGWNRVPSNNFNVRIENGEVILDGSGQGHGIGLCQRGARAMAENGASFREILSHYFPNAVLMSLEATPAF